MGGGLDVSGGSVSSGPTSGGGWDEHPGSSADVGPAPGHHTQDAILLGPAGLSPAESAKEAQVGALHRRYRPILEDDLRRPRKQRHTAKRIFERLRDEYGFDGQYTIVKDYVREHRRQTKEMFVPLSHPPGLVDLGVAPVRDLVGLAVPRDQGLALLVLENHQWVPVGGAGECGAPRHRGTNAALPIGGVAGPGNRRP